MKSTIYFLCLATLGLLFIVADAVGEDVHSQKYRSNQQYRREAIFNDDGSFKQYAVTDAPATPSSAPPSPAGSSTLTSTAGSSTPTSTAGSSATPSTAGSSTPTSTTGSSTPTSTAGSSTPTSTAESSTPTTTAGSSTPTSTAGSSTPTSTAGSSTPITSATPSVTTSPTTSVKPTPPHCTPGDKRPINGSCRSYFECDKNYNWVENNCTTWCHNFNPSLKKCDWNWKYICVDPTDSTSQAPCTTDIVTTMKPDSVSTTITTVTTVATTTPPECTKQGQQKAYQKGDCKDYLECDSGKWVKKSCSWGYDFDINYLECRWSWWAKC